MGLLSFEGYDGNDHELSAYISARVPPSATVASNDVPAELQFYTRKASDSAPTLAATIESGGGIVLSSSTSASAGSYKLYVDGDAYTTGSWSSSDSRLKANVTQLGAADAAADIGDGKTLARGGEGVLDRALRMRGVEFTWSDAALARTPSLHQANERGTQVGLIAQEVEAVFPQLVREAEGYKTVAYDRIPAVLLEALREEVAARQAVEAEVAALQARLAASESATASALAMTETMRGGLCALAAVAASGSAWAPALESLCSV